MKSPVCAFLVAVCTAGLAASPAAAQRPGPGPDLQPRKGFIHGAGYAQSAGAALFRMRLRQDRFSSVGFRVSSTFLDPRVQRTHCGGLLGDRETVRFIDTSDVNRRHGSRLGGAVGSDGRFRLLLRHPITVRLGSRSRTSSSSLELVGRRTGPKKARVKVTYGVVTYSGKTCTVVFHFRLNTGPLPDPTEPPATDPKDYNSWGDEHTVGDRATNVFTRESVYFFHRRDGSFAIEVQAERGCGLDEEGSLTSNGGSESFLTAANVTHFEGTVSDPDTGSFTLVADLVDGRRAWVGTLSWNIPPRPPPLSCSDGLSGSWQFRAPGSAL